MSYRIFLDDEREPPNDGHYWHVARNHFEFFAIVLELGFPSFISFDHDLRSDSLDGYWIAKELVDIDQTSVDDRYKFPDDFDFYVHSQNPVGKKNIESYLTSYLKVKNENHKN